MDSGEISLLVAGVSASVTIITYWLTKDLKKVERDAKKGARNIVNW